MGNPNNPATNSQLVFIWRLMNQRGVDPNAYDLTSLTFTDASLLMMEICRSHPRVRL